MATTHSRTDAKPSTSASATKPTAAAPAESTGVAGATEPHDQTAMRKAAPESETKTWTLTIPLDRDTLNTAAQTAATAVMVPVTVTKNVLKSPNTGVPAYLGLAALAAVGVVEWPVAAAAGAGLAYLRRWGPLRPETAAPPQPKATSNEGSSPPTGGAADKKPDE